jgi:hypothetical protein
MPPAVWLTHEAAEILADQADDMVTAYRARLRQQPWLAAYSGHPDGTPNPEYGAATKPRFDRWIIDACTRPDQPERIDGGTTAAPGAARAESFAPGGGAAERSSHRALDCGGSGYFLSVFGFGPVTWVRPARV